MTTAQPDSQARNQADLERLRTLLSQRATPPAALVRSFGCQLNAADGEKIKGLLCAAGYQLTEVPEEADLILLNTCAVRDHAEQRVFGILGSYKHLTQEKPSLILGLCGCMSAEETVRAQLKQSYPFVGLVLGTGAIGSLPRLLLEKLTTGAKRVADADTEGTAAEWIPTQLESSLKASVPIMYGCNNFCSYCIVPYVRGRERSRAPEAIFAQVEQLVRQGCKEICLLGQNVNSYGRGLDPPIDFPALLRQLDQIPGQFLLRFLSSHPKDVTPGLIAALRDCTHVEPHLHLPVQSGSNRLLEAMNRRYTAEAYLNLVSQLREAVPEISLSTDIIVGFPGETAAEFEETLALVKAVRFDSIFPFIYSKRTGTKAALLDDPTPAAEKSARMQTLLTVQRQISEENFAAQVGKILPVLFDGIGKGGAGTLSGRTPAGTIAEVPGDPSHIGHFRAVEITEARNWAVCGVLRPDLPVSSVREPIHP